MKCDFCHQDVQGLTNLRVYTRQGIKVCGGCYHTIDTHRHRPYSEVMDKLALLEAGYRVNRKLAMRNTGQVCPERGVNVRISKRKKEEIVKAYRNGEVKRIGGLGYSVPSRFFALGITPAMVNEVIKTMKERG